MYIEVNRRSDLNLKQDDMLASRRFVIERKPDMVYFYELEEAVVLDIILDENHPEFKTAELDPADWPKNIDDTKAEAGGPNFGVIGKVRFRFLNSERGKDKDSLNWAYPIENTGITEYPLMNEVVIVGKYLNRYYYSRKLNTKQLVNSNAAFIIERVSGLVEENRNIYESGADGKGKPYDGPVSEMSGVTFNKNYVGVLGNYFKFNHHIRALRRFEGDTILESRFGSSIRFGAYDSTRKNDEGVKDSEYEKGGGNPMLLIRNRQAPIDKDKDKPGFTAKGYTLENINADGSSIHLTSGLTVSDFIPTTRKVMFQSGSKEEQPNYSPSGSTDFKFPVLSGDQLVVNSDRVIVSSKANETFFFSKKRMAMVTDSEFTVDAHKQVVITTNAQTVINSPKIFLGEYGDSDEPVLLGRTTTYWLYQLCNWMINQTDLLISQAEQWHAVHVHQNDSHKDSQGAPLSSWSDKMKAYADQLREQRNQLIAFRDQLPTLMSNRVFTTGGGGAPGSDGGELKPL